MALKPDLAVVPEAGSRSLRETTLDWSPRHATLSGTVRELGVFAFGDVELSPRKPHDEDAVSLAVVADVSGRLDLTVLAVCARPRGSGHGRYARALLDAIARHSELLTGPVVVAGDFNTCAALDVGRGERAHMDVVDALSALGLSSAWHHVAGCDHGSEPTGTFFMYRHPSSLPLHLDYCFVPTEWLPRVRTAWIGPADDWLTHSDHLPLVVDIALS